VASELRGNETASLEDPTLLAESAEELYEHAPVGYLSTLPGGLVVRVNETLLGWTGHNRDDLVGRKRLHDLLAPGARIYYETHYAPLLELQGSVREIAVELVGADGRRVPALLDSTLVRDDAGVPQVVRTTVFNAADRRRYERELLRARADAESRARAALALAHVNDGVVLVDANGHVDVVNAAAERILGVTAADAVGRPVREVIPEWDDLVGRIPLGDPGAAIAPAVLPLARGGHELWLAAAGVDSGDGVVYTLRDVTADHALEQLRGDVVAIVSHELRTPLTGVYGSAQTLLARYETLDDDTRRQLLAMIVEQSDRLTRIVDQILLTSRLDTEDVVLAAEPFDATTVVESLHAALPPAARERVVVDPGAGARGRGDAGITAQVLTNLVDNALKYSAGAVHLGVATQDGVVRFTVADEGAGVPVSERERIFEKFYRLDPSHQLGVGGTGLGLYIAKQLTERMNGRIELVPRDRGTTVVVELPAAD
jgi:PAS domain S-box-containing protein